MKKYILTILTMIFITGNLSACEAHSGSIKKKETKAEVKKTKQISEFDQVIDAYLAVKVALQQDDFTKAKNANQTILNKFKNKKWGKSFAGLNKTAKDLDTSKNIEEARLHFKPMSNFLIENLKKNKTNKKLFKQFCPMALKNTGAAWLSESRVVENPYFGKSMYACGESKEI